MRRAQRSLLLAAGLVATTLVVGCGSAKTAEPSGPSLAESVEAEGDAAFEAFYVGADTEGAAFVAVGWRGDEALGYLCDGHGLGLWFSGTSESTEFEHPSGVTLTVEARTDAHISGRFDGLASGTLSFDLSRAGLDDALIRLKSATDGAPPSGLIISNLEIRGAVVTGSGTPAGVPTVTAPPAGAPSAGASSSGSSGASAGGSGSAGSSGSSSGASSGGAGSASSGSGSGAESGGHESLAGQSGAVVAIRIPPPSVVPPPKEVAPITGAAESRELRECRANLIPLRETVDGLRAQLEALEQAFNLAISKARAAADAATGARNAALEAQVEVLRVQRDITFLRLQGLILELVRATQQCQELALK